MKKSGNSTPASAPRSAIRRTRSITSSIVMGQDVRAGWTDAVNPIGGSEIYTIHS
jgi:hypothetical protein